MIVVEGLVKRYGDLVALDGVSFKVEKGQIVGFLGANGAGKTTTMDILCGCIGADQGSATIAGFDITKDPQKAKACLGYLPDEPPLHMDMKVNEFIRYVAKLRKVSKGDIKKRVNDAIEKLSLGDVQHRLVGNLSKGYKQRVGLAQAIVHSPDILILDEPTEGLDPNQIIHIRDLIKSLAGEHTILLSSHILSEVQNTCDHIVIINKGKVIQQGTYNEIVQSAESGAHYRLQVKSNQDRLLSEVSGMNGVHSAQLVEGDLGGVDFFLDCSQTTPEVVMKTVIDGDYGLEEFALNRRSLEDVFIQLTR